MTRHKRLGGEWITLAGIALAVAMVVAMVGGIERTATALPRYNDGCQNCHGHFSGGISPAGTVFPNGDKHFMHRSASQMDTACDLCHTSGDGRNPWLGSSDGTGVNPGVGCAGCHGRDYGKGVGNIAPGLRAHHALHGVTFCGGCHFDDPCPLPEDVMPTYYGTGFPETLVDDPCNSLPGLLENWSVGDTLGLDNDGDDRYDANDPDCGTICAADLNGDGPVNSADLTILLGAWAAGTTGGDTDGDCDTDSADLTLLLGAWAAGGC